VHCTLGPEGNSATRRHWRDGAASFFTLLNMRVLLVTVLGHFGVCGLSGAFLVFVVWVLVPFSFFFFSFLFFGLGCGVPDICVRRREAVGPAEVEKLQELPSGRPTGAHQCRSAFLPSILEPSEGTPVGRACIDFCHHHCMRGRDVQGLTGAGVLLRKCWVVLCAAVCYCGCSPL